MLDPFDQELSWTNTKEKPKVDAVQTFPWYEPMPAALEIHSSQISLLMKKLLLWNAWALRSPLYLNNYRKQQLNSRSNEQWLGSKAHLVSSPGLILKALKSFHFGPDMCLWVIALLNNFRLE